MATEIFIWWLVAQTFGLVGLPLAQFVFRSLPDRGYAFSKALGLLLTGYLAWLLAMLGLAPFGGTLLVICALVVGGIGFLTVRRQAQHYRRNPEGGPANLGITATAANPTVPLYAIRDSLIAWLRANWGMLLGYEALFALALIFLALLRSHNFEGIIGPNPWFTERPMDYALFNAIRRSPTFPPHDPWLSGYSINYYYFGYLLMAAMATLSGLGPPVAYNLSLALIFALTASGAAGIVFNLIALTTTDDRRSTIDGRTKRSAGGRWSAAGGRLGAIALTVILVLFAANQGGALEIITGTNMVVALEGPDLAHAITNGLGPREPFHLTKPFEGDYFSGTAVITPTNMIEHFDWWQPSRAVWDSYTRNGETTRHYTITEFPFFSFWLGDMHPHVMALPFGLLALALALQTLARRAAPAFAMGRRGWLELGLTGIVLGSLYAINSWDFPTYLLMFLGALLLLYVRLGNADGRASGISASLDRVWWRQYLGQAALVAIVSVIMLTPFYLTFRSLVGGKEPLVDLPILAIITRTIGVVTQSRTPIYSFTIIFGLFLLPLVVYVVAQGRSWTPVPSGARPEAVDKERSDAPAHSETSGWRLESHVEQPGLRRQEVPSRTMRYLPWATLVVLILGPLIGFPLLVLLPLALYAVLQALERAGQPAAAFALWAFALICLVCFGTDVIYIRDVFEGDLARLNTIFKFYYQAWVVWGMLAGYALWWLYTRFFSASRPGGYLFSVLFLMLLVGALVYPWLTAGRSFREGQRVGLDGKTPREATPEGAAAIAWLRANAAPGAVILESVGGDYNGEGFGGVSASTGLATVLGWPGHEDQWRGGDPTVKALIGPRKDDVAAVYTTTDVAQARDLLAKYKVSYVYVGALERATYPAEGLAKFVQLGEPVFEQGDVTIYRVTGE